MKLADLTLTSPAPEGIVNPADLNNGWYGVPIPWDKFLIDRLVFICESIPKAMQPDIEVQFQTHRNEGPSPVPTPTYAYLFWRGNLCPLDLLQVTEAVSSGQTGGLEQAIERSVKMLSSADIRVNPSYQGFARRHPDFSDPVGELWKDHKLSKQGRTIYRVSESELANPRFSPGAIFRGLNNSTYTKCFSLEYIEDATKLGWQWGKWVPTYYWQLEYNAKF